MKKQTSLILIVLSLSIIVCAMGCDRTNIASEGLPTDTTVDSADCINDSIDQEEWDNWLENYNKVEGIDNQTPDKASTQTPAQPQQTTINNSPSKGGTKQVPNGKKIYISTYGAQGQVWGHVVMNGNVGSGTIHDANENTLTIRVTRHGNELFGFDQNGREYVFKL